MGCSSDSEYRVRQALVVQLGRVKEASPTKDPPPSRPCRPAVGLRVQDELWQVARSWTQASQLECEGSVCYLTPSSHQAARPGLDLHSGDGDASILCISGTCRCCRCSGFSGVGLLIVKGIIQCVRMHYPHSRHERVPLRIFCTGCGLDASVVVLDIVDCLFSIVGRTL
jgi:hypothetical protein